MTARLNYSKWDQLEVSDDSDIEGHPNVDHKSLVRWKQRDIHEKREARRQKIAQLEAQIACNAEILRRLAGVADDVRAGGAARFSAIVERLKTSPALDKPNTSSPNQPTYDAMLEASLVKVWEDLKNKGVDKSDERLDEKLLKGLQEHIDEFKATNEEAKKELEQESAEKSKKITSEDIHEGWDSKYVPAKPTPPPLVPAEPAKAKGKKVEYETLNAKSVEAAQATSSPASAPASEPAPPAATDGDDGDDEEDEDDAPAVPDMTPELLQFAKIRVRDYDGLYAFIQAHRSVVVPGASDALMLEAFSAESRGDKRYAQQCVQQSLALQYCDKLGRDGVRVFFARMRAADQRAEAVFARDLQQTYEHMAARAQAIKAEADAGAEQIQLVPQDASQSISFNVPDGPPPEHLVLEGPGTEDLDVEQVREALMMRWTLFEGLDAKMQAALRSGSLEQVNKVLGKMPVPEAERVVQALNVGGILSFADENIRDATGKGGDGANGAGDVE